MVAVAMGVDDSNHGFAGAVREIELERLARGVHRIERVDDDETGGALHERDVGKREPTDLINTVCDFEEAMNSVELSLTPQAGIHGRRSVLLYKLVQIRVRGVRSRTDKPPVCILEISSVAKGQ